MSTPKDSISVDGVPSDGIGHDFATPEQLARFRQASEAMSRWQAPVLLSRKDPHGRLFVAAFDGTGNNQFKDPLHATNVAHMANQIELLNPIGDGPIYVRYLEGPGTQDNPLVARWDGISGASYSENLEKMYADVVRQSHAWKQADPEAVISVQSIGFSRGASQAAGFTRLLDERGIPDIDSRTFDAEGRAVYTRYHAAPGQVTQTVGLFDPVATGVPMEFDRRLPPSVMSGFQITAADERRALFPSDQILPPGLSDDGRFLNVMVPGAHSDVGGGYRRDGLSIRSGNLMIDYCNSACDQPFLHKRYEPQDVRVNVIHRSTEGKAIYRLDPREAIRGEPSGTNLRLAPEHVVAAGAVTHSPEAANVTLMHSLNQRPITIAATPTTPETPLPPMVDADAIADAARSIPFAPKVAGALGAAGLVYEATTTTAHTIDLLDRHNVPGAQSGIVHFGTRNIGAVGGATLGAEAFGAAGAETGPFDVVIAGAGALVGGGLGAVAGDKIANAYDNHRIYNQTDPNGISWHYDPAQPQQGWTRDLPPLPHAPHGQHLTADPALAARLTYQANTTAVELAMAQPPAPRDPYTQPADAHDSHSLTDAPWTRDAQTRQWSRHVVDQVMEHGMQRTHDETASPARSAQLDAAAQQTIAANLANSPRGIAEQYQAMYQQHDWAQYGPMPQDVATALRNPANTLQASDGHTYARQPDGQWHTPGRLWGTYAAEGNVRAELNATFASAERQHDAQAPAEPARTVDAPTTAPSAQYLAASATIERIATAMERGDRDTLRKEYEAFTQSPCGQVAMEQARATVQREEQQRALQESRQPPRDPRDARHPDHALNQGIRDHVETLHCKAGIFIGNKTLDHLTASVALNAREQGLARVDQLHFNADRTAIVAEQKSNGLDMSHKLSSTNIQQAMQTPPEHAYRQMAHETQRQADVQQAIQQQIAQSRQGPSQGR